MEGGAQHDTVFIQSTPTTTHISTGLEVTRVTALFSISLQRDLEVYAKEAEMGLWG